MKFNYILYYNLLQQKSAYFKCFRLYSNSINLPEPNAADSEPPLINSMHCYKTLFPWQNFDEFTKYLISCVEYNKDGLLVLNKPYGIKIHGHDKPGARPKSEIQFIKPSVPECEYTIEDALPELQKHFNLDQLSIVKSAEKYTSGIVLLSSSDKVTEKIQKSFMAAKHKMKPHLIHWAVTVGYPVVPFRKEKVAIKFTEVEIGQNKMKQPVILTDFSKRDCKFKKVYPVHVESRTLSVNNELSTSLVEIASTSVKWHFVRVYASSRLAPVLGDILYGSRMKKILGVPVKVQLHNAVDASFEPIHPKMSQQLHIPRGMAGQIMIPTMLHLKSLILPNYLQKNQDFSVTASLPPHFKWTVNRLNLLSG